MNHNSMTVPAVILLCLNCFCYCHGSSSGPGCSQKEREALLSIKADLEDPSDRLYSWAADNGDCCTWHGVLCDNITGHVTQLHLGCPRCTRNSMFNGKISPSLLQLQHLGYLDLSSNDFQGIPIPGFLGSITSLKSLFLDRSGFGGAIPLQLGNLTNLRELSLNAGGGGGYDLSANSLQWLSGLSSLEYLDLRKVDLSNASDWLDMINIVPSLSELYLSSCRISHNPPVVHVNLSSLSVLDLGFNQFGSTSFPRWVSRLESLTSLDLRLNDLCGPIPDELQNLTSLVALSLSSNNFNGPIPGWLSSFRHLRDLNLKSNELDGEVSNGIWNLTSLVNLDLSFNYDLEGHLPVSFENLCHLTSLRLSYVKLQQSISDVLRILGECPSSTLEMLSLDGCQLFGPLTDRIEKLKRVNRLLLNLNSISGPLPWSFGKLTSLNHVNLAENRINGTIPKSFWRLEELEHVDISLNSIEGIVSLEIHFANLTKLSSFYASGNRMALEAGPDSAFPQFLEILHLNSWYVGPGFPKWLRSFRYLKSLDLSESGVSEPIPDWFWSSVSEFYYLNFSHNRIPGRLPSYTPVMSADSMFDFSWNKLEGPIPVISSNLTALDLSNNNLSGNLLKFLCFNPSQMRDTEFLNLQGNLLSGEIPDCWRSWKSLKVVRLGSNELRGEIPESIGTMINLLSLRIQNNSLTGQIPPSIGNCHSLVSVDLSDNRLQGFIPNSIWNTLSRISIVNLRGNQFRGNIPEELCHLQLLQILDLSRNSLSGNLPSCVANLTAMANSKPIDRGVIYVFFGGAKAFVEYQVLVTQGQVKTYSTILNYVRSLDLSCNLLSGKIPNQITTLVGLKYLNLSHNSFSGSIPEDLAAMESLESLDLAGNRLSGAIPAGVARLTFLNHLNLSCNELSGRIPSSTQLQSFESSSFGGNEGLCGSPLGANCGGEKLEADSEEGRGGCEMQGFSVGLVVGFVVGFWGVFGPVAVKVAKQ